MKARLLHLGKHTNLAIGILMALSMASCAGSKMTAQERAFYDDYSRKLGVNFTGKENKDLLKTVAEWRGTPYVFGGTSKRGVDCSGFVMQVYKEVYGIELPHSARQMRKASKKRRKKKLKTGYLVFFKTNGWFRRTSHVGIYLGDQKFIHASSSNGVTVNSLTEEYYRKHYSRSGRFKKAK